MDIYRLIVAERVGNLSLEIYFDRLPTSDEARFAIQNELDNWPIQYKTAFLYKSNGELNTMVLPEKFEHYGESGWPTGPHYYVRLARYEVVCLNN